MDVRGIRYFIKLAECLNFTHAAKEFYITQTAMSQSIARMEEELGFKLFERNNRNVILTPAGRYFYGQMYTMIDNYDTAVQNGRNLAEGRDGRIRVAVGSHMDGLILMSRMREFRQKYPTIQIQLQTLEPRLMENSIKQGKVDLGMCWTSQWENKDPDLEMVDLAGYPVVAMVRKDHPLARAGYVDVKRLQREENEFVELRGSLQKSRCISDMVIPGGVDSRHLVRKNRLEEVELEVELYNRIALLPGFVREYIPRNGNIQVIEIKGDNLSAVYLSLIYMKQIVSPTLEKMLDVIAAYKAMD